MKKRLLKFNLLRGPAKAWAVTVQDKNTILMKRKINKMFKFFKLINNNEM